MSIREIISVIAIYLIIILSLFDAHIAQVLDLDFFLGLELVLLAALSIVFLLVLFRKKIGKLELITLCLMTVTYISGCATNNTFLQPLIGVLFLFKIYLFFIVGRHLVVRKKIKGMILFHVFLLSALSGLITILQLFVDINPFNFLEYSSKYLGILDNPNKNGISLLTGFIISNYFLFHNRLTKSIFFFFFLSAIIISGSRQAIILFAAINIAYYILLRREYIISLFILLISILFVTGFKDTLFSRFKEYDRIVTTGNYFRLKAVIICGNVFLDNPIFGVGPGYFGGKVADDFNSKYHQDYKLFDHWIDSETRPTTIDMYWPHVLAEIGLIGVFLYLFILMRILQFFRRNGSRINNALFLCLVVVLSTSFFSMSLAAPSISVVVFLFAGLYYHEENEIQNEAAVPV